MMSGLLRHWKKMISLVRVIALTMFVLSTAVMVASLVVPVSVLKTVVIRVVIFTVAAFLARLFFLLVNFRRLVQNIRLRFRDLVDSIDRKIRDMAHDDPRNYSPEQVLAHGLPEEKESICKVLGIDYTDAHRVMEIIRRKGSNFFSSLVRGTGAPYKKIVSEAARKLGIEHTDARQYIVEAEMINALKERVRQRMTSDEWKEFEAAVRHEAAKHAKSMVNVVTGTGAVMAAQASGFGVYVAASTVLSTLTGALGITLPFAVYTGLSSLVSAAIGPVGWAVLGLWGIKKISDPDYKKTIPCVLVMCAVRARLISDWDYRHQVLLQRRGRILTAMNILESSCTKQLLFSRKMPKLLIGSKQVYIKAPPGTDNRRES